MFCIKCGARNSDEAVYCRKCGTLLEAEEETRVARSLPKEETVTDETEREEKEIFSVRPTLTFIKAGYAAAVAGAFLLVAVLSTLDDWLKLGVSSWIFVLLGLLLLLIPAFYHFKRNIVRYTLTDSKIEIDEGFIFQNTRNIPLRSIQDVSVSSSITQRMLGFGNLVIDNATEDGGKIVLKNIDSPKQYADILLRQMRQLNK
ncbi:MAG TPA: PH domain-containing protein [Pyrinomonadaceae bacterium]|nr:PH domain-containing protein [Pyrinomonadaceae bacterium]